ncbi:hypothetical protein B0H13DRAFT_2566024 [Mycena leptocephala]|nr:hypothetical protein B0H13DRAFT_2566024 [Mycena leptocephala]
MRRSEAANAGRIWPRQACQAWGSSIKTSRSAFGLAVAGEFSNGYNDCGLYLTGVNGTQSDGGNRDVWMDSSTCNATVKDWYVPPIFLFSTKVANIGNATDGVIRSPLWSYQLGLQNGYVPTDLRTANGTCTAIGVQF